ncbi:MAG: helix-turn-helix domain-containing protein [Rhizobiales bacterium]|nr:helix-turn-helix domain-containing protein [Hyphomicrobiales bacterium]
MPVINRTWSRHRILAEIKDRGFTTIALDVELGLKTNDIAVCLRRPYPKTEKVLANWLKIPMYELWPDRYYSNGTRRVQQSYPNRNIMLGSSKIGEAA